MTIEAEARRAAKNLRSFSMAEGTDAGFAMRTLSYLLCTTSGDDVVEKVKELADKGVAVRITPKGSLHITTADFEMDNLYALLGDPLEALNPKADAELRRVKALCSSKVSGKLKSNLDQILEKYNENFDAGDPITIQRVRTEDGTGLWGMEAGGRTYMINEEQNKCELVVYDRTSVTEIPDFMVHVEHDGTEPEVWEGDRLIRELYECCN